MKHDEPLKIVVKKAEVFKDGPEIDGIERYPMRSTPRGLVLIITNITYEMVDSRPSAQHDERNLKKLYEDMGFKVILHSNLTGRVSYINHLLIYNCLLIMPRKILSIGSFLCITGN